MSKGSKPLPKRWSPTGVRPLKMAKGSKPLSKKGNAATDQQLRKAEGSKPLPKKITPSKSFRTEKKMRQWTKLFYYTKYPPCFAIPKLGRFFRVLRSFFSVPVPARAMPPPFFHLKRVFEVCKIDFLKKIATFFQVFLKSACLLWGHAKSRVPT